MSITIGQTCISFGCWRIGADQPAVLSVFSSQGPFQVVISLLLIGASLLVMSYISGSPSTEPAASSEVDTLMEENGEAAEYWTQTGPREYVVCGNSCACCVLVRFSCCS